MTVQVGVMIKGLRKSYSKHCVLDIGELSFEPGHSYALIGANGSGKSTLLRILAGASSQSDGDFEMFAVSPTASQADAPKPFEASIGYMPQKSYVFGFTVFKNVAMALEGLDLDKQEEADRVNRALEAVGMSALAQARGNRLSGGEAQRVALARALAYQGNLLLLDEPFSAVDAETKKILIDIIKEYAKDHAVMLVTHDISEAKDLNADIIVMK